jgi:hypothetical protein
MPIMPPIPLHCVALRILKLLSIAAILAGVLAWADLRVWAQGGKPAPADAGNKTAGDKEADEPQPAPTPDEKQDPNAGTDTDQPDEPATPSPVAAGNYLKPTVDASQKNQESQIMRIVKKGTFEGDEQATFDAFFKTYFFRNWAEAAAWADPSFTPKSNVQDPRTKLRNYFKQSGSSQVHDYLLALSMNFLKILAEKNFHPAARYNAMLAIGELNDSEPAGVNSPVVPHAGALAVLVESLKKGPSDALRVAALRGLLRHCGLGIADAKFRDTEVIPALLEVAKSRPPKERSPEGHAWMRTLAIESLAALHSPGVASVAAVGPNGVLDAMVKIVGDPASPPAVRCAAARALGGINPAPKFGTTPAQLVVLLRQLTADFCAAELDRQEKFPDTRLFREEIRQRLNDVKVALTGIPPDYPGLAGDAAADLAQEIRALNNKLDVKAPKDEPERDDQDKAMKEDIKKALATLRGAAPSSASAGSG